MQKEKLSDVTVVMIRCWEKKDEKGCYREYFALNMNDRRIVKEMFKQMSDHWFPQARKSAKGIYKLIEENFEKEVDLLTDTMKKFMWHWFFSSKEVFYNNYLALGIGEREAMVDALQTVFGDSKHEEWVQAVKDIPIFLETKK